MLKPSLPVVAIVFSFTTLASAQTVYSGLDYTYDYAGSGDISLEQNQDRITDNVWITRNTTRGIFNIAQEPAYQGGGAAGPSPVGTLWAIGTTADYDTLSYIPWAALHNGNPFALLNTNVVVYLEDDNTYIDLMFTNWGNGATGGAFTYDRSIIPTPASASLIALGGLMASRRRR